MSRRTLSRVPASLTLCMSLCAISIGTRAADAPRYDSVENMNRSPGQKWGTPEDDARPGEHFFLLATRAVAKKDYTFAVDMYKVAASWAYKTAEYNLAVMYAKGDGVPVDRPLMDANQQVSIFALCYRERVAMARLLERVPALDAMGQIGPLPMAVPGQSLAGWLLIGADGGAYRSQLSTQWKDGTECARALLRGEIAVAAGLSFELESVLRGNAAVAMGRCLRRLRSAKDGPPGWW